VGSEDTPCINGGKGATKVLGTTPPEKGVYGDQEGDKCPISDLEDEQ